jgi:hypothetical protein
VLTGDVSKQNVSLALNAILPTSELAQLSETGRGFATEGEAARASAGSSRVEKTIEPENENTEREVRTSGKLWLTGGSSLCAAECDMSYFIPDARNEK